MKVRTAAGAFDARGEAVDGRVVLSIRPEKIRFVPSSDALVTGRVKTGVFLGNQWLFQVESPLGELLVIRQNAGHPEARTGDEVGLAWDTEQVRMLLVADHG